MLKFGAYEKCVTIVALCDCRIMLKMLRLTLKPLSVNERFISRILARYREIDDIVDWRRGGCPRSVYTQQTIHAICEWVKWNPVHKQKRLAFEMNVQSFFGSYFVKRVTPWCVYRHCVSHLLDARLKKIRYEGCKKLLKKFQKNAHHWILFTNEKIFDIKGKFNCQNDCVCAKSCYKTKNKIPRVQKGHHHLLVMVWWGILYSGATQIYFCDVGVKTNGEIYRAMLNDVSLPVEEAVFVDKGEWCF